MRKAVRVATSPARVILHQHPARTAREHVGGSRMPLTYESARQMSSAQVAAIITGAVAVALATTAATVLPW